MSNLILKKLEWDSNFFSKNIAEAELDHKETHYDEKSYDLIVIKQKSDFAVYLPYYTESFKETKVIFQKDLSHIKNGDYSDVLDTDHAQKDFVYFTDLAYESGKMSRFLLDPQFGEVKFKELYDLWVINSLNKKFAIKTFFVEQENTAVGFVTLQESNGTGKIGLIATHPDFQGKGLGRKLLEHAENYCIENNILTLEIPTQKENTNACMFYLKMGYDVKETVVIKHFWKNSGV